MRRLLPVAALVVAVTLHGAPTGALEVAAGRCMRAEAVFPTLGRHPRTVRLYLPPSYDRAASAGRRYPVVYLLHGWPGSDGNWVTLGHACATADTLIARGEIPEVILVFPSGAGPGLLGRSLWLDSWDGRAPIGTWLAGALVAWVDSTCRTRREPAARALIGLSDGGTAAFVAALRHPEVFGAAASHSGRFRLRRSFGDGGVVGPEPGATRLLERDSPATLVRANVATARRQVLYLDCGLADEALADDRAFHRLLDSLAIAHTYREHPGSHDWTYWRDHLRQSLVEVTRAMR